MFARVRGMTAAEVKLADTVTPGLHAVAGDLEMVSPSVIPDSGVAKATRAS